MKKNNYELYLKIFIKIWGIDHMYMYSSISSCQPIQSFHNKYYKAAIHNGDFERLANKKTLEINKVHLEELRHATIGLMNLSSEKIDKSKQLHVITELHVFNKELADLLVILQPYL